MLIILDFWPRKSNLAQFKRALTLSALSALTLSNIHILDEDQNHQTAKYALQVLARCWYASQKTSANFVTCDVLSCSRDYLIYMSDI